MGAVSSHGMSAAVRSGVAARDGRTQRLLIRPGGHLGTARWHRPLLSRIRSLFPHLRRITSIAIQPRELHVEKQNPVAPAIKASITAAVVLVAITLWRRRER